MDLINKGVQDGKFDIVQKDRIVYENSMKVPNFACVTINGEDHTLGNLVRQELLKDRRVRFAGYRKPHPLFDLVEIKVQSNGEEEPCKLIESACFNILNHVSAIENSFENALNQFENEQATNHQLNFG